MPALDGLRGVAILMVVLTHAAAGWGAALSIVRSTPGLAPTFAVPHWISVLAASASSGVQLFFVVSAFTLTARAARNQESGLASYALRRIARVGPAYWLAGLCYTAAAGMAARDWAPHGLGVADLAVAAGFGSAWQGGASMAVVPGGWSVSCEVSFYLVLPLLIRVIDGRIWRALLLTCAAMAVAKLHAWQLMHAGRWEFTSYANPIEQAPVFLCGITAALAALSADPSRAPRAAVPLLLLAIVVLPFLPTPGWHSQTYVPFGVAAALTVALAALRPPRVLASRFMRRIGEVSYSMYLVHFAVLSPSLWLAERLIPADDWRTLLLHYAVTCAASFLLACATYALIERPAIRWAAQRTRGRVATMPAAAA